MWNPKYLKNLCTLKFFSRMKMDHLSAPGCLAINALNASKQMQPRQFILLQILLTYILKIVSLSPSNEYWRQPKSTSTLNFVCKIILNNVMLFPHWPAQQLGTFFNGVMILSTDRFSNMPLSLEILPETKSLPSVQSSFLKLLNSGRAFMRQLASLSLLIISKYLSRTGSVMSNPLKTILSCSGRMKISPISFSSDLTVLLGIYSCASGLLSFVFIFSRTTSFLSFWLIDCFLRVLILGGLLPILGRDELLFSFFALADLFRLRLD